MKTDKKYLITTEVPCTCCKGERTVFVKQNPCIDDNSRYGQICQSCQGSGKEYIQVSLEEALQDIGYVPNEEKPSEHLRAEYRGYTVRKARLLSGWEVDHKDWTSLRRDWQGALAFIDAELRKDIPEPQF